MVPSLYIETTIPSYLAAWPSRDLIVAGHQQITHEWWRRRRSHFQLFVSQFVIDEAGDGDSEAANARLALIEPIPKLNMSDNVIQLASRFLGKGLLPQKASTDAGHIAIAAIHGMNFLMTWNCTHIANAEISGRVAKICLEYGYTYPVVCTPEELMGGSENVERPNC